MTSSIAIDSLDNMSTHETKYGDYTALSSKKLAALVIAKLNALPYNKFVEVQRVWNISYPLASLIDQGYVMSATASGRAALIEFNEASDQGWLVAE